MNNEQSIPQHFQVMITGKDNKRLAFKQDDKWTILHPEETIERLLDLHKMPVEHVVNFNEITPKLRGIFFQGIEYVEVNGLERLIIDLLRQQRELCAKVGKHYKFGWYKYRPDDMVNAPSPLTEKP